LDGDAGEEDISVEVGKKAKSGSGYVENSFLASVAEKTDKIINYSAMMNTTDEMIEKEVEKETSVTMKASPEVHHRGPLINVKPDNAKSNASDVKEKIVIKMQMRQVSGDE